MLDGIIVGAAAAAIGTIVAYHFIGQKTVGGGSPMQPAIATSNQFGNPKPLYAIDLAPTPYNAAPVAQVNPNQEAAFNQQPIDFVSAFGPHINQPSDGGLVLPQ